MQICPVVAGFFWAVGLVTGCSLIADVFGLNWSAHAVASHGDVVLTGALLAQAAVLLGVAVRLVWRKLAGPAGMAPDA